MYIEQEIKIGGWKGCEKKAFFSFFLMRKRLSSGQKLFPRPYFPLNRDIFVLRSGLRFLQESDKGQIFYWSIQTCSRIRRLIGWWIVTMLKKPQNCSISDFFDLTPKYFLPILPYIDPVSPSTNHTSHVLTKYHQYQTVPPQYRNDLKVVYATWDSNLWLSAGYTWRQSNQKCFSLLYMRP